MQAFSDGKGFSGKKIRGGPVHNSEAHTAKDRQAAGEDSEAAEDGESQGQEEDEEEEEDEDEEEEDEQEQGVKGKEVDHELSGTVLAVCAC